MNERLPLRRILTSAAITAGVVGLARYAFAPPRGAPRLFHACARLVMRDADLPVDQILRETDRHYEMLAPAAARAQTSGGRFNLRMSAFALAMHRAMREAGVTEEWATELVSTGLFRVMRQFWRIPDAIVARLEPDERVARARRRQRLARRVFFRPPDWLMHEVAADHGYGFDVTHCVLRDFLTDAGAARFCEDVICRQDLLMASVRGDVLTRTTTLAGGGKRCDFRFA